MRAPTLEPMAAERLPRGGVEIVSSDHRRGSRVAWKLMVTHVGVNAKHAQLLAKVGDLLVQPGGVFTGLRWEAATPAKVGPHARQVDRGDRGECDEGG
jgi:hypothetical protein